MSLPISRSSCEQRAGRAGRTAPGVCIRLYSRQDYEQREAFGLEEILRTDLSEVVLRMSELGIRDYEGFPFITRPKSSAIASAEETLRFIDAISDDRKLTAIGGTYGPIPSAAPTLACRGRSYATLSECDGRSTHCGSISIIENTVCPPSRVRRCSSTGSSAILIVNRETLSLIYISTDMFGLFPLQKRDKNTVKNTILIILPWWKSIM